MKRIILMTLIILVGLGGAGLQGPGTLSADEPVMGTYAAYPLSVSSMVKPNVLIVMDSSTSMMEFAFTGTYNSATTYDGLFVPTADYSYDTGGNYFFTPKNTTDTTQGLNYWEGNFLNWLCMRRIDIAKIVLSGGEYVKEGTTHLIKGFTYPADTGNSGLFDTTKSYNYHVGAPNPETYTHQKVDNAIGPYFTVNIGALSGVNFYIRVKVSAPPTGIIQDMAPQVRFGLEIFSPYHPNGVDPKQGGQIVARIGSSAADIATVVNAQRMLSDPTGRDTWTQMAETLFTAAGYFGQVPSGGATNNNGPRYHANDYTVSNADDPYYSAGGPVDCVKSSVIFISDGEANEDSNIQSYAIAGVTGEILGADNYLDNVAYWAHTTDLRAGGTGFGKAVDGIQTLTLYTVSAFGGGAALLQSAAKFGGFTDSNGNNLPDLPSEWDKDSNSVPDNYFTASTAAELKAALSDALVSILSQMSSGTAISMVSTNSKGQGSIIQAYFRPLRAATQAGEKDVKWLGYLNAFWIDEKFNLREDTIQDKTLDLTQDKIISFSTDAEGNVRAVREAVDTDHPFGTGVKETVDLPYIFPVWDAGQTLAERDPVSDPRTIYTYLDKNKDGVVATTGEFIEFVPGNDSVIKPYLGVADNTAWAYLGDGSETDRVGNLIRWIHGQETGQAGNWNVRSRQVEGHVWKLGDIINSTPVSIANPQQQFNLIFGDESYEEYYLYVRDTLKREAVVYAGANDGMLHAFTTGKFDTKTNKFNKGTSGKEIGEELWAFIPQAVLSHLKWLPSKDYTHTYYVDLTPMISDAQIYDPSTANTNGWATVLVGGLNMGGKSIQATGDFGSGSETRTFSPSYFALDITDPQNPKLLWERTYTNLGFSASKPSIIKVKDKWFAVFGSGPTDYEGNSDQRARVFVVDLKTGEPYSTVAGEDWLNLCSAENGFINSPVARDHQLDYSVDALYFGESYYDTGTSKWKGRVWKYPIEIQNDNPLTWSPNFDYFFSLDAPITAELGLASFGGKVAAFFGTGRYIGFDDKASTDQQYLVSVRDPFYLYGDPNYENYDAMSQYPLSSLFDVDLKTGDPAMGWYYALPQTRERSLTKPIIFANTAIFTSFVPNTDLCGYGGDGYLWLAQACSGSGVTSVWVGKGIPSRPILRLSEDSNRRVDVLGQQPKSGAGTGTVLMQTSTKIEKTGLDLNNIPKRGFYYWKEK